VKSLTRPAFWRLYQGLPGSVQSQARKAYQMFAVDPDHPGLNFKKLNGPGNFWSVRVTQDYRAVGLRRGDEIVWLWIGSHSDFDKQF